MTTKVYFNSACPVCNAGIKNQRERMAACGATDVEWIDVHREPERVAEVGTSLEDVRERLHVRNADGSLGIGSEAFNSLWAQTRGQRWLAAVGRLPGVATVWRWLYNVFARQLYRWNLRNGRW